MNELVTKIPLQEKIAELERRIVALEQKLPQAKLDEGAWTRMWKEFNELFR